MGLLPTFIIIGAMKCGTSSLHKYLSIHPEVCMSSPKELDFFVLEKNYSKGIEWYKSHFYGKAKAYGESSTNYTKYPKFNGVPARMYSVIPNAKLVYIIRNPIDRLSSHYIHNLSAGRENRNIASVLSKLDNNHYVMCSKYYMQLEQYLKYYSRERILIITAEELRNQRIAVLKRVFNFLGVDDSFYSPEFSKMYHPSSDKTKENILGRYLLRTKVTDKAEKTLPLPLLKIYRKMTRRSIKPIKLPRALEGKLTKYLSDDMNSLRKYIGYDFKYLGRPSHDQNPKRADT